MVEAAIGVKQFGPLRPFNSGAAGDMADRYDPARQSGELAANEAEYYGNARSDVRWADAGLNYSASTLRALADAQNIAFADRSVRRQKHYKERRAFLI